MDSSEYSFTVTYVAGKAKLVLEYWMHRGFDGKDILMRTLEFDLYQRRIRSGRWERQKYWRDVVPIINWLQKDLTVSLAMRHKMPLSVAKTTVKRSPTSQPVLTLFASNAALVQFLRNAGRAGVTPGQLADMLDPPPA